MTPEVLSVLNSLSKETAPLDPLFLYRGLEVANDPPDAPDVEEVATQHAQYQHIMSLPPSPTLEHHHPLHLSNPCLLPSVL